MDRQTVLTPQDKQRLLAEWNARRTAQALFDRGVRRTTERLLRRPPTP
ncbi:hypothetical protein ACFWFX_28700 [Streptomyces roseolus]